MMFISFLQLNYIFFFKYRKQQNTRDWYLRSGGDKLAII
jgi:hypothetical protein